MKELDGFLQNLEKNGTLTKWGEKIAKAVVAVLIVIVLIILAQIGMFIGIFNWLEGIVRTTTGLDAILAKAVAFLLLALLFSTPLSGFIWSFLPIPGKNKKRNRLISLSVLSILFFGSYFLSRDVYFNPETGEPVKYYSITSNGEYKFFSSDGYDPITGDKLKPVSSEMIREMEGANKAAFKKKLDEAAKKNEADRAIREAQRLDSIRIIEYSQLKESEAAQARLLQKQKDEETLAETNRLKEELKRDSVELERKTQAEETARKIAEEKRLADEIAKENMAKKILAGYRIALNGNSGPSGLGKLFIPFVMQAGSGWQGFTCQVSFENNSSFTFDLYNFEKVRLFEIPPGEKTALPIESGPYYLKARELKEMLPFNLFEKRPSLNVQLYDRQ